MGAPISLFLQWCLTDRLVFIKAIRMIFKKIHAENAAAELQFVERTLGNGKTVACIDHAIAAKPVSIHAPLTRLLAGLSVAMGRHGVAFDSHELQIAERPSVVEMLGRTDGVTLGRSALFLAITVSGQNILLVFASVFGTDIQSSKCLFVACW